MKWTDNGDTIDTLLFTLTDDEFIHDAERRDKMANVE